MVLRVNATESYRSAKRKLFSHFRYNCYDEINNVISYTSIKKICSVASLNVEYNVTLTELKPSILQDFVEIMNVSYHDTARIFQHKFGPRRNEEAYGDDDDTGMILPKADTASFAVFLVNTLK